MYVRANLFIETNSNYCSIPEMHFNTRIWWQFASSIQCRPARTVMMDHKDIGYRYTPMGQDRWGSNLV